MTRSLSVEIINTDSYLSMGNEWFNDKTPQFPGRSANLLVLPHALFNPRLHFLEVCVYFDQPQLATSFDQLIWLYYKLLYIRKHNKCDDLNQFTCPSATTNVCINPNYLNTL
jgi:hypothetical protein